MDADRPHPGSCPSLGTLVTIPPELRQEIFKAYYAARKADHAARASEEVELHSQCICRLSSPLIAVSKGVKSESAALEAAERGHCTHSKQSYHLPDDDVADAAILLPSDNVPHVSVEHVHSFTTLRTLRLTASNTWFDTSIEFIIRLQLPMGSTITVNCATLELRNALEIRCRFLLSGFEAGYRYGAPGAEENEGLYARAQILKHIVVLLRNVVRREAAVARLEV